jgi:ATP-dependent helicase/nuclease subunit A
MGKIPVATAIYNLFVVSIIMKNIKHLTEQDAQARQHALDPQRSFIVQAPAGSGKTELLVRRYLVLLTRVRVPETIIAVTFTRKAAAEMRLRILSALEMALQPLTAAQDEPRWQLAKNVLQHDQTMQWNLLGNPHRLRIQTIDSLCQTLTRQMPLRAAFAEQLAPLENPHFLYHLATQELIASLEQQSPWQPALQHLLSHVDNDFTRLEMLLSELLACREQWLAYLAYHPTHLRSHLEKNLQQINQTLIAQLNQLTPTALLQELTALLNFSLQQRGEKPLRERDRDFWQAAHFLLCTAGNEWRKEAKQTTGFPAPSQEKNPQQKIHYATMKQRFSDLIQGLQQQPGLHEALSHYKKAPPLFYSDTQWQTLKALFTLLPALLAHLKLVFQQYKRVDYTEILLCALTALGDTEKPTDLALHLDYHIEHLLVDEFQDTSLAQFQLIEKLIGGWQTDDGRTLFLVGDPMQSIYRFRKAEVGLFLRVCQHGIGNLTLHPLSLSVNFRSPANMISWINSCFSQLLPPQENRQYGAIAFAAAVAAPKDAFPAATEPAVTITCCNGMHPRTETHKIIAIIQKIKQNDPGASIAILVRARTHLSDLLPALQAAAIPYHALDIESLGEKSAVQDLLALTRALLHLGDRIAWLALLRAPFCGLDLSDLYAITQFTHPTDTLITIWQQLTYFAAISLKEESKQRLRRIVPILQHSLAEQSQLPLSTWIKKTWLALGGPTTLNTPEDMIHIQSYLNYLEKKYLLEGPCCDFVSLEEDLGQVVTQTDQQPPGHVAIMTIHKAKGLEFDHVILPSLHRKTSGDRAKLLLHQELLTQPTSGFLLAPIKASDETEDVIYNYLAAIEKQKAHYEISRLLYVASTRAKKSLHLLGSITWDSAGKVTTPAKESLLHHLWPVISHLGQECPALPQNNNDQNEHTVPSRPLKRLVAHWQNPLAVMATTEKNTSPSQFFYRYLPNTASIIGTVIHRLLYHISQEGLAVWDKLNFTQENTRFIRLLEQAGIVSAELNNALTMVKNALGKTLQDPRGRWLLSQEHQHAHSELAVTFLRAGKPQNLIIDRTFIDTSGIRWIIDYKTNPYQGEHTDTFLKLAMQQHKEQLETYAAALALQENNAIYLALYFPLDALWHAWIYTAKIPIAQ